MARGAGEPTAKPAKVDEADEEEEEDPLVRRKEELVVALKEARSREDARAERVARRELVTLCAKLEAKNEKRFRRLPAELWQKIVDENVHQNDMVALAMTCRFFREKQKEFEKKVETSLKEYDCRFLPSKSGKMASHTLGWFRRVCDTFEILPGVKVRFGAKEALHEGNLGQLHRHHHLQGNLLKYALFIGSVEILRWLMEEKGWELFFYGRTVWWAGLGGSVEVLEYLNFKGYKFTKEACEGAAIGGCLKALKFLRGLDPPCPWDEWTCRAAAEGGHLDVLKWARSQTLRCPWDDMTCFEAAYGGDLEVLKWLRRVNPPCPWHERTCEGAAYGGHLEVLKWVRSQDPPCPWGEGTCSRAAEGGQFEVLKWLRAQKPPCPWNRRLCKKEASAYGHWHAVDWIDQQEVESEEE